MEIFVAVTSKRKNQCIVLIVIIRIMLMISIMLMIVMIRTMIMLLRDSCADGIILSRCSMAGFLTAVSGEQFTIQ